MLLQERIEELGSGILTILGSRVKLIGFTCPERLNDYCFKNQDCHFSMGIYKLEPLDFSKIQNNALFVVNDKNNNKEYKYQFELLKKDIIKYKDQNTGKMLSRVYYIRKCNYTNKLNYQDINVSVLFDTPKELSNYFRNNFGKDINFNSIVS